MVKNRILCVFSQNSKQNKTGTAELIFDSALSRFYVTYCRLDLSAQECCMRSGSGRQLSFETELGIDWSINPQIGIHRRWERSECQKENSVDLRGTINKVSLKVMP